MANVKITELTATTNPANTDVLPIVSGGATKQVKIEDLLENAGNGNSSSPAFSFNSDSDTGMYRVGVDTLGFSTGGTSRLVIDSSGNLGIGTTSATDLLTIGGVASPRFGIQSSTTGGDGGIEFGDPGDDNIGFIVYDHSANALRFGGNASERMRIDSSGNVGIGTSSPDSGTPLHVAESSASLGANPTASAFLVERAGNVAITLGTANTGTCSIFMGDTDNLTVGRVQYDNSDNSLGFWANSSERMRIASNGNVGIGTTSPSRKLVVSSGGAEGIEFSPGDAANNNITLHYNRSSNVSTTHEVRAAQHIFSIGSSEKLRINSSGNVLIGGTSAATADIALNADGSITAAGSAVIGDTASAGTGVAIRPYGRVTIRNDNSGSPNDLLIDGYTGNGSNQVFNVKNNGTATFSGTVTANGTVLTSDSRFKENITPANPQLADIEALGAQLKNFDWNADAPGSNDTRQLGLIAQDVEAVCPGIVKTIARTKQGAELTPETTDEEGNVTPATYEELDDSYKGISHDALIMKLLGAVAELSAKVAALEAG